MKNSILYVFILMIVGCSSNKEMQKKPILYYGKTACLGKCPVFDLYIFDEGKALYNGIRNVDKKGKHYFVVSKIMLDKIQREIIKLNTENSGKSTRDLPNTILKFLGKKLIVQDSRKIAVLDELVRQIIHN